LSEQPANANVSLAARAGEIRALVDQALKQRREDGKAAESSLRRAIELATAARVASLEALARHELGCLLRRKLEAKSEALGELHRALELRMELKDVAGQIDSLLELGTDAYQSSDLANALPPLHEAERLCSQSGNLPGLALAQEVLSGVYSIAGRNEDALTYAERCLDVAGQVGDRKQVAHALDNLACVESELGRHDKACAHFSAMPGRDEPARRLAHEVSHRGHRAARLGVGDAAGRQARPGKSPRGAGDCNRRSIRLVRSEGRRAPSKGVRERWHRKRAGTSKNGCASRINSFSPPETRTPWQRSSARSRSITAPSATIRRRSSFWSVP
jgi:tetratricopeptide (TPR) repeat protein